MARIPRGLWDLNLTMHHPEHVQFGEREENLQGPPEVDNIVPGRSHESISQIKIIWPNGETRQIVGEFRLKNLSQVAGGKIIVETNEKGVPNERSASILSSYHSYRIRYNSLRTPTQIDRSETGFKFAQIGSDSEDDSTNSKRAEKMRSLLT